MNFIVFILLLQGSTGGLCVESFQRVSSSQNVLQIEESQIVEIDEEGPQVIYRWQVMGAPVGEGLLEYEVVEGSIQRSPHSVKIREVLGMMALPGVGAMLKQRLRQRYPDHSFVAFMAGKNKEAILQAIEKNPLAPDFSNVPAVRALQEPFRLRFFFSSPAQGAPAPLLIEIEILPDSNSLGPVWLNRDEVILSEDYQSWTN